VSCSPAKAIQHNTDRFAYIKAGCRIDHRILGRLSRADNEHDLTHTPRENASLTGSQYWRRVEQNDPVRTLLGECLDDGFHPPARKKLSCVGLFTASRQQPKVIHARWDHSLLYVQISIY